MTRRPPPAARPPSRGLTAGRWLAAAVLVLAAAGAGCESHAEESVAGLVIASNGAIDITDAEGQPQSIHGPAGDVRLVAASNGRIAAGTMDHKFFVSDQPRVGESRTWRPLALDGSSSRTPAGMDLSQDGGSLAIVLGDPDTPGLDLVTVDLDTGTAGARSIDLVANGPPSWLGPDLLALEVIRPDQHSGIATVDATTGDVAVSDAQGITPSATRDGGRIAVVDATSGLVTIVDQTDWLAGAPGSGPGITSPVESSIQDIAIDADGTRLAIAYAANSGAAWSVVILRLNGVTWESVSSIPIPGDTPVSIDWLD